MPNIVATTSYNQHAASCSFQTVSNPISPTDTRSWGDVYQGSNYAADILSLTALINQDLDTATPPPESDDLLAARLNNWTQQ